MKHPLKRTRLFLFGILLFMATSGCLGNNKNVELIPMDDPIACSDMLAMDLSDIPDDDFNHVLNTTYNGPGFQTCWKPLMKKALVSGRHISKYQLARAVHVFNRNDSRPLFAAAIYQYFREILNGNGIYGENERKLLTEYVSITIENANSKKDLDLENARLICSRLDPDLYNKYFL